MRVAGRIQQFLSAWKQLTSDKTILDMVEGCHITFKENKFPKQYSTPHPMQFSAGEIEIINQKITKLLKKGVLDKTKGCQG